MNLIILASGVYNDAHNKAHRCEAGDEITTSSVYGRLLIDDGYARLAGETPPSVPPEPQGSHRSHEEVQEGEVITSDAQEAQRNAPGDTGGQPSSDVASLVGGELPLYVILALRARGLRTVADVAAATDGELLTVRGIGAATLRKIREAHSE